MYRGVTGYTGNFQNIVYLLSLKIAVALTNSVDSDEMPHVAAFHLGLHCLPKYSLGVTSSHVVKIQHRLFVPGSLCVHACNNVL